MASSDWDSWHDLQGKLHKGCKAKISRKIDGLWIHMLLSPPDEPDPRNNHVHVKYYNSVDSTPILCSITDNGRKSHSRKMLIERINEVTGLNLEYR